MKKVIALIVAASALSACGTTPPAAPRTAGDYCKMQSRMTAARAGMDDFNPMTGRNTDVEQQVYADCVSKVVAQIK